MTDFRVHLFFTCFLIFLSPVRGDVQLGCTTATIPSLNNLCPVGYTQVMSGGCCPLADVYTISGTTTTTAASITSSTCEDKINPNTGVSDCPGMKSYCNNPIYVNTMKNQCPKTCGYCTSPTSSTCQDTINPNTGVNDCPGLASYCQNPTYHDIMKDECPKTCGYC